MRKKEERRTYCTDSRRSSAEERGWKNEIYAQFPEKRINAPSNRANFSFRSPPRGEERNESIEKQIRNKFNLKRLKEKFFFFFSKNIPSHKSA